VGAFHFTAKKRIVDKWTRNICLIALTDLSVLKFLKEKRKRKRKRLVVGFTPLLCSEAPAKHTFGFLGNSMQGPLGQTAAR